MQAREVMDAMQKDADFSKVQLLKVDGGASNNNLLMQMQADALQVGPHLERQALQSCNTDSPQKATCHCRPCFSFNLLQMDLCSVKALL